MKDFLIKVVLPVVGVVLVLLVGLEVYMRHLPNDIKYKHDYMSQNAPDIKILVLGPSYNSMGIKPAAFDMKGFNLAGPAQAFCFDYWMFFNLIDQMDSLKYVIMPYSITTQSGMAQQHGHFFKDYVIFFDYPMQGFSNNFKVGGNFMNFVTGNGDFKFTLDKEDGYQSHYFKDVELSEEEWQTKRESAIEQIKISQELAQAPDYDETKRMYCEVVSKCLEKNIKIVVVRPPRNLPATFEMPLNKDIDSIVSTNNPNIKYIDFQPSVGLFDNSEFFDVAHLNPRGAVKLTRMLNDSIRKWEGR